MEVEDRLMREGAEPGPRAGLRAAATVGDTMSDTGVGVLGQQQWEAVHARRAAGHSQSRIARELDLDRKTVRSCLRQTTWQPYQRKTAAATLLDAHRTWLVRRAPEVNHSARILHQELCAEHGFTGSYETVKVAVRPLREAAFVAALTQARFETEPGQQAQVDWGQLSVLLGEVPTKVHVLVMTLGYSRRAYAEGFLHERMPNLLAAHEHAFAHFGGRCETLLYDRMRTVVLSADASATNTDGASRSRVRLNPTFEAFARHWGFTPRLCRAYRPQTKGKVESGVKYLKRNFAPGRVFRDLEDFNTQLFAWQAEVADLRIHGTTHQRPIDRFAAEAQAMASTVSQPSFLQAVVRQRVVAEDWLVALDGNRYSVPFGLIGKTVQVVREGANWVIRHRGAVVAEHAVLAGTAQLSVRPEHGPGAVPRNARKRYAEAPPAAIEPVHPHPAVEVRDLDIYEQLLDTTVLEAA